MTIYITNRYANQDLYIAKCHHDSLGNFVSRDEQKNKPFHRYVDAWWAAMAVGVKLGERTPLPSDVTKFNDGRVLSSDPWRITHLELLALAEEGPGAIDRPANVIRMASEYANSGFPYLLDKLIGQNEPTLNLVHRLDDIGDAQLS